jgi:hypothetical protein
MLRSLLIAAALFCATPAHALTNPMAGMYVDLAGSGELSGSPIVGDAGGQLSLGWWRGRYDDSYAIGRFWSLGAAYRAGFAHGMRHTALAEVRRGVDLLVVTPYVALIGGAVLAPGGVAPIAQLGLGGKFRTSRFYSLSLRLDGGVIVAGGRVGPQLGARLGVAFSRPFRHVE